MYIHTHVEEAESKYTHMLKEKTICFLFNFRFAGLKEFNFG